MNSRQELERERAEKLRALTDARKSLRPTSRTRLLGVTRKQLDRIFESERREIEQLYESRLSAAPSVSEEDQAATGLASKQPTNANTITEESPPRRVQVRFVPSVGEELRSLPAEDLGRAIAIVEGLAADYAEGRVGRRVGLTLARSERVSVSGTEVYRVRFQGSKRLVLHFRPPTKEDPSLVLLHLALFDRQSAEPIGQASQLAVERAQVLGTAEQTQSETEDFDTLMRKSYSAEEIRELAEVAAAPLKTLEAADNNEYADTSVVAARAAVNLGALLKRQGDLDGAVAAYRRAIELAGPDAAEAAYRLGMLLQERGDLDGAIAAYRHAIVQGMQEKPAMPQ